MNPQELTSKIADVSATILRVPIYPAMLDAQGWVQPDVVLKLIDVAGCIPPKQHMGPSLDPVTASIEHMDFLAPAYAWDVLVLDSRITRVWKTSMESRVVVSAWSFRTGEQRTIAYAYLITVATKNSASMRASADEVPPLRIITPEDKLLVASADLRKKNREAEKDKEHWVQLDPMLDKPYVVNRLMTPHDSNGLGLTIFGGVTLAQMYQTAQGAIDQWDAKGTHLCIRQDRLDFLHPAKVGEHLVSKAQVSMVWQTSVEVQVDCWAYDEQLQPARLVATTYFVFICLDSQGEKTKAPEWQASLPHEQRRAEGAEHRRFRRKEAQAFFAHCL
jgi:acyl-CoA hydrolase